MKTKLFYYYTKAMHQLKILLFWHISFISFTTWLELGYLNNPNGNNFYLGYDYKEDYIDAILWAIGLIEYILLFFVVYFSYKYIDLEFYIRLLMYGHRVLNHFEKMSYFITKSWLYKDQQEQPEDDISIDESSDSLLFSNRTIESLEKTDRNITENMQSSVS